MDTPNSSPKKKPLILVVEDIPKNMEVVCSILRKEGYRLAMAGNGKQAVDTAPAVHPDLILLDIMMPVMDGYQACEALKENPVTADIPIIFLTAKSDTDDVVKGFELGAVDYVTKPFKKAELLSRVKTHLELKFSRESLVELNATKDKFFSIVAHDLKDPVQYLVLAADALYNNYDAFGDEKRKDYISRFYNNSHLLSELLVNLLDWARSQRGKIGVNPQNIDLQALARENVQLLEAGASEKNVAVSSQVEPGVSAFADENMVRAVIRNLVANAVKFTPGGGEVKIEAASKPDRDLVEISVTDTGVGIPKENLEKLFRIDAMHSTKGTAGEKGAGLGLILCKEFIEKNNGTITATSQINKGTTFKITLPPASTRRVNPI